MRSAVLGRAVSLGGRRWTRHLSAAAAPFDPDSFTKRFLAEVQDVPQATDPALSSQVLRRLIRSNELSFMDMANNPEKFFLAHRLLSSLGLGGFGIRFTVQFNLFAGSIVGLGNADQVAALEDIQREGQLGCFLLTEMQAGVLSGLIVETTADWDPQTGDFVLHTPSDAAAKNWISQGFTAELGVVIADLRVKGQSYGPHAFLMDLREGEGGELLPGIRVEEMSFKTVANDLDNARVWFDQVRLPKAALLSKFADIVDDEYVQVGSERMRIEVIGQRLLTGRLAIAEAALLSARVLHMKTESHAKQKVCNGINGEVPLAEMPQLAAVFRSSYQQLDDCIAFTAGVEQRLNQCLRGGSIPDRDLVDAISVAKIKAIETSINCSNALRQEVGSYALMHGTGFELMDMFLCCKFAEGDSRILQMKLARDRLKQLAKDGLPASLSKAVFNPEERAEVFAALSLARHFSAAGRDPAKLAKVMNERWEELYHLADLVAERHMNSGARGQFLEPIVERLEVGSTHFDHDWKAKLQAPAEPHAAVA